MGEAMSRRIRGVFNAANFWAIVLYNVLSLNSLEFAALVGGRLVLTGWRLLCRSQRKGSVSPFLSLLSGFPLSTLSVLFVTYCGVQLVKERERRQALLDEPELKPIDGGKKKAE